MVIKREGLGDAGIVNLALPGDLLGVEASGGMPYTYTTYALTNAWAMPDRTDCTEAATTLLYDGLLQLQRQSETMVRLRTGSIKVRMAYLLKLLADSLGGKNLCFSDAELPTLKDFSSVLGTASQTVCRELDDFLPKQFGTSNASAQVWTNKLAHATYAVSAAV